MSLFWSQHGEISRSSNFRWSVTSSSAISEIKWKKCNVLIATNKYLKIYLFWMCLFHGLLYVGFKFDWAPRRRKRGGRGIFWGVQGGGSIFSSGPGGIHRDVLIYHHILWTLWTTVWGSQLYLYSQMVHPWDRPLYVYSQMVYPWDRP